MKISTLTFSLVICALPLISFGGDDSLSSKSISYLNGKIKTYEGGGCSYYKSTDINKKDAKAIAADDYKGEGIVFNISGRDILLKEINRSENIVNVANGEFKATIKNTGKSKSCGEECSQTKVNIEIVSGVQTIDIASTSRCGS